MIDTEQEGSVLLWLEVIRSLLPAKEENLTLLDLCCGEMTATRHLRFWSKTCIDVNDSPNRPKLGNVQFFQEDVRRLTTINIKAKKTDVCICSDGLEHFNNEDASDVLDLMKCAAKLSIVFVPTGESESTMVPFSVDPHKHKSRWSAERFGRLGWSTMDFPNWHARELGLGAVFAWKETK
jgi:hypothetical protein